MANLITDIGRGVDETPDGFVRFQYKIPNLKAKHKMAVQSEQFSDWGFSCIVRVPGKTPSEEKAYRPFIEKLPYEIEPPPASFFKVDEDEFLHVWLKKKDPHKSWRRDIMDDTLEKADG